MSNYIVSDKGLESVGDSIRNKRGISKKLIYPEEFKSEIDAIKSTTDIKVIDAKNGDGTYTRSYDFGDNPVTRVIDSPSPIDFVASQSVYHIKKNKPRGARPLFYYT